MIMNKITPTICLQLLEKVGWVCLFKLGQKKNLCTVITLYIPKCLLDLHYAINMEKWMYFTLINILNNKLHPVQLYASYIYKFPFLLQT